MKKIIKISMLVNAAVLMLMFFITIPLRNVIYDIVAGEINVPFNVVKIAEFIFNNESLLLVFFGLFASYFTLFLLIFKSFLKQKVPYFVVVRESLVIALLNTIYSYLANLHNGLEPALLILLIKSIFSTAISLFALWRIDNFLFGKATIKNTVKATVKKLGFYILLTVIQTVVLLVLTVVFYYIFIPNGALLDIYENKNHLFAAMLSMSVTYVLLAVTDIYPKLVEKVLLSRKEFI